ncbi:TetR family transcriptional regulator [Kushneria sinocarnis]|uniref:TetR family transcriptional regulator n=1 Tax=Kushneria sinocarnis TaxID=595502 RepID=A0A420WU54_9GAMM|nr:TetR family transcriptional regulator [Kushneria sinocarnis]RKQ96965.1 TetR family transcriptional regulator [Kushneria sinocarnis]
MRKTKEEAKRTRQALLNAAEHLFIEKGLSRTTHNDIAQRAGVTRGALNWHFAEGKLDIFSALLERKRQMPERLAEHMACCERSIACPAATMRRILIGDLQELTHDAQLQRILLICTQHCEFAGEFAWVRTQLDASVDRFLEIVGDTLERAQAQDEIRLADSLTTTQGARLIYIHLKGLVEEWIHRREMFDLEHNAELLVDSILRSVILWQQPRELHAPAE